MAPCIQMEKFNYSSGSSVNPYRLLDNTTIINYSDAVLIQQTT